MLFNQPRCSPSRISAASPALPRWQPVEPCSYRRQSRGRASSPSAGTAYHTRRCAKAACSRYPVAGGRGSGSSQELGVPIGEAATSQTSWAPVEVVLNRMSKWLVAGSLAIAALWKRDAQIMWALNGAVVNDVLSSTLKKMFNHKRPAPALRSDPGMPSSHAQSIFYAAVFLVLSMFYSPGTNHLATIVGAATVASASYLSWLRVSQRLHTLNQILVGATVGSAFGALWFALWRLLVQEAFDSSPWVRIPVILGSVVFCVVLAVGIIRHWLKDEW